MPALAPNLGAQLAVAEPAVVGSLAVFPLISDAAPRGRGGRLTVPVSCVEAGRWDGSRHGEVFTPAPQTANPR